MPDHGTEGAPKGSWRFKNRCSVRKETSRGHLRRFKNQHRCTCEGHDECWLSLATGQDGQVSLKAMTKKLDVIVIGTGAAASAVAHRCRSTGWQVAVVDSRPFGGTCALRGCDPKKVLVGAADAADWVRRMNG